MLRAHRARHALSSCRCSWHLGLLLVLAALAPTRGDDAMTETRSAVEILQLRRQLAEMVHRSVADNLADKLDDLWFAINRLELRVVGDALAVSTDLDKGRVAAEAMHAAREVIDGFRVAYPREETTP